MKHNFIIKQVNSAFEDTSFFVRNIYKKKAFLLDCGRLGNITNSEILSISDIFISHTHIDHFYGFDRILRSCLRSDKTVRFFGPPGIINNIWGKLQGYTWNLVENYTFIIEAIELNNKLPFKRSVFKSYNAFKPEISECGKEIFDLGDGFTLDFAFFDHGTISVGYRINEFIHINIKKNACEKYGLVPGKWLTELKDKLRNEEFSAYIKVDTTNGVKEHSVKELEEMLVIYSPPQDLTFITDIAPTFENYKKAIKFAANSHILLIESMFLKSDILHSIAKKHLTVDIAKDIFFKSGSKYVKFFHFSPKNETNKNEFFQSVYSDIKSRIFRG